MATGMRQSLFEIPGWAATEALNLPQEVKEGAASFIFFLGCLIAAFSCFSLVPSGLFYLGWQDGHGAPNTHSEF